MAWLFPREHGAYGQLGFPLATALLAGAPTPAALLLVAAFIGAFIAYEPALVLLGQRGPRARRELGSAAARTFAWTGTIAIVGGVAGAWLMPAPVRWTVLAPAAFALATIPLIVQRAQKTAAGELHVALTLASCALPVGAAAGMRPQEAAGLWFVLTLGFWAATLAVRAIIARQRREPTALLRAGALLLAAASPWIATAIAGKFLLHPWLWIATLPLSGLATVLAAFPPPARRLREAGWALIAASAIATAILVVLARF